MVRCEGSEKSHWCDFLPLNVGHHLSFHCSSSENIKIQFGVRPDKEWVQRENCLSLQFGLYIPISLNFNVHFEKCCYANRSGPSTEPCGTPQLLLGIENQHRRNSEIFFIFIFLKNLVRYVKWVWLDLVCTSKVPVMINTFALSPKDFRKLKGIPLISPLF